VSQQAGEKVIVFDMFVEQKTKFLTASLGTDTAFSPESGGRPGPSVDRKKGNLLPVARWPRPAASSGDAGGVSLYCRPQL